MPENKYEIRIERPNKRRNIVRWRSARYKRFSYKNSLTPRQHLRKIQLAKQLEV